MSEYNNTAHESKDIQTFYMYNLNQLSQFFGPKILFDEGRLNMSQKENSSTLLTLNDNTVSQFSKQLTS